MTTLNKIVHSAKINFFNLINKKETAKAYKIKLAAWQTKRKNEGKRGGTTANTHDVFYALLSCIAPTMADIQENQPDVCLQAIEQEQFFAFVYNKTIKTKINNLKNLEVLQIHEKTVYNHIKVLLSAGILTKKLNYNKIGDNPRERGYSNPKPEDLNPAGRGKLQLFFSKDILKINPGAQDQISILKKSLLLYRVNPLQLDSIVFNKTIKSKSIVDNAKQCVKVVLTTVKATIFAKEGKEQERKISKQIQICGPVSSSKKDFFTGQLFQLLSTEIYNNQHFNQSIQTTSKSILDKHLEHISIQVQAYRSEKIKSFSNQDSFVNATSRQQMNKLKGYTKHLPDVNRAAIEVLANAIQKQARHAIKYKYISKIGFPPDFLISKNFIKALDYSLTDWRRINTKFFAKNIKFSSYCDELQKIGLKYTSILQHSSQSIAYAYQLSLDAFKALTIRLEKNKNLTPSNKKTLLDTFKYKLGPIFNQLSKASKFQIQLSTQQ